MTIDIVVGGRFHADRMASALIGAGYQVRLFTSYPRFRFPNLPTEVVHAFPLAEIGYRLGNRLGMAIRGEEFKMKRFGAATASYRARTRSADILVSWSSFGLEAFRADSTARKIVVRDSAHISEQLRILRAEYEHRGLPFPYSSLSEARELEEYQLADRILVPSEYARRSFLERGFPATKLHALRLAVDTQRFKPDPDWRRGKSLRVIYFGFISFQKGIPFLIDAVQSLPESEVSLTLVGDVEKGMEPWLKRCPRTEVHPALPQEKLATAIRNADVFVMPTLHDGFGMTVPQAMASGLLPIVTDHCGAAELVQDGKSGFIVPSGNAEAIAEKIALLAKEPDRLYEMRKTALGVGVQRDWESYGAELADFIADTAAAPVRSRAANSIP